MVTIDTSLPVVSLDDLTTNDTTPALTGAIDDPTATVVVNVDGIDYPATNNGDGTWTLADNTLPALIDGPHTVAVTATDPAGNTATDTATLTIESYLGGYGLIYLVTIVGYFILASFLGSFQL
ncbi:Ig-like domain-containing protein, partial [Acinetobacter baumannii]|nr:Ig-like domain-containing protein [Acinetobacter baumannii]